jgi:hypothetical protein
MLMEGVFRGLKIERSGIGRYLPVPPGFQEGADRGAARRWLQSRREPSAIAEPLSGQISERGSSDSRRGASATM